MNCVFVVEGLLNGEWVPYAVNVSETVANNIASVVDNHRITIHISYEKMRVRRYIPEEE